MGRLYKLRRILTLEEATLDRKVLETLRLALSQIPHTNCSALANGGQGVLYLVSSAPCGRMALKIPSYGTCPVTEHSILEHTLAKEVCILQTHACSAIPHVLLYNQQENWLLREYVSGVSLSELMKSRALTSSKRALLCRKLVTMATVAFKAFHESPNGSFVIRDLKPINLVVEDVLSEMKLVDVGSARPETAMVSRSSRPHRLGSGKWLYWAPEQLMANIANLDRRADYFSLAATSWFILSGTSPYSNSDSHPATALANYHREYKTLLSCVRSFRSQFALSSSFFDFMEACLHPCSIERPQTMTVAL